MSAAPATITDVLSALLHDPGRPRITWYGPEQERVELSGAVLGNWVTKTTNLLVEEFDVGPGTTVRVDLPVHWRTVIWALAVWRCGGTVQLEAAESDVLVTTHPRQTTEAVVAVDLPALSRRWPGPALPPGALDAAQAVMTYGDVIGWVPATDRTTAALTGDGSPLDHNQLLPASALSPVGARVLFAGSTPRQALLTALGALAQDGSLVLAPYADSPEIERIVAMERITVRF